MWPQSVLATTVSPTRIEISGNPGQVVQSSIKVINEGQTSKTLFSAALNFEPKDETGEPNFITTKEGLASWIDAPQSFILGPKEQKSIPFSIHIPKDAEPGGYFAALFASSSPPVENENGTVTLADRVGALVLLRVNGNITDQGDILEFKTKGNTYWYKALPIEFYYRFQNSGLDRVKPFGDILIKNWFGRTTKIIAANPDGGNVLPKSIRRFNAAWISSWGKKEQAADATPGAFPSKGFWQKVQYEAKNFAFGRYSAELNLVYGTDIPKTTTAKTAFFVFPWHLMLVLTIGGSLLFIILRFLIKRYNRWVIAKSQKNPRK